MTNTKAAPNELIFTCILDAPRELVFRCMTDPEHLTHFWGPVGVTTPLDRIVVDARPGGAFETTMIGPDGSEHTMRAVYVEVDEPERLVWIEPEHGMTSTSTFTDLGDGRTEVRIHQTNVPSMFEHEDAQKGFKSSLEVFNEYLKRLA